VRIGRQNEEITDREEDATIGESFLNSFEEPPNEFADVAFSRRQALRRFGGAFIGGLAGSLLAVVGPPVQGAAAETVTTGVIIDGTVVYRTEEPEFTFSTELPSGCHSVRVVQGSSSGTFLNESSVNLCSSSPIQVEVIGSGVGDVQLAVKSVNVTPTTDAAT